MVGITAGSAAAAEDVRRVFGKLIHPASDLNDPRFLGSAPRRYKTLSERVAAALAAEPDCSPERARELRNQAAAGGRRAVAYYDVTFSPVKSVSVYYAALMDAGRTVEAAVVVDAYRAAIDEAMCWPASRPGIAAPVTTAKRVRAARWGCMSARPGWCGPAGITGPTGPGSHSCIRMWRC